MPLKKQLTRLLPLYRQVLQGAAEVVGGCAAVGEGRRTVMPVEMEKLGVGSERFTVQFTNLCHLRPHHRR